LQKKKKKKEKKKGGLLSRRAAGADGGYAGSNRGGSRRENFIGLWRMSLTRLQVKKGKRDAISSFPTRRVEEGGKRTPSHRRAVPSSPTLLREKRKGGEKKDATTTVACVLPQPALAIERGGGRGEKKVKLRGRRRKFHTERSPLSEKERPESSRRSTSSNYRGDRKRNGWAARGRRRKKEKRKKYLGWERKKSGLTAFLH